MAEPLWRAADLGQPLPVSPHAVSVCLPTWQDVVDYEEGRPRVVDRLQSGYPRFVVHPRCRDYFQELARRYGRPGEFAHAYPSRRGAERCRDFVRARCGAEARLLELDDEQLTVVLLPEAAAAPAKSYWRYAGEGLSSRRAESLLAALRGETPGPLDPVAAATARLAVRQRIAGFLGVSADDVYLFPSGMAAIYAIYRAVVRQWPGRRTAQFGFPYVDTLRVQRDLGHGALFLPHADATDRQTLAEALADGEELGAVFCETPSNPLLGCPELPPLAELCRRHQLPLVVDDTVGTFENLLVFPWADVQLASLTKFFAGTGDVMAGAAVINPLSDAAARLREALDADYEDLLGDAEARLLDSYSQSFSQRVRAINARAEALAEFLAAHPAVAEVGYPKLRDRAVYEQLARPGAGFGGLLSFCLRRPADTPQVYDRLRLCKGPNLGTSFSLCCPYTLLAHYDELDFVESRGVSRWLLRVSVGLEAADDLIARFAEALG